MSQQLPPDQGYFYVQLPNSEDFLVYLVRVFPTTRVWGEPSAEILAETLNALNLSCDAPLTPEDVAILKSRIEEVMPMVTERRRLAQEKDGGRDNVE